MPNQEHLDILKQGAEIWNKWRKEHATTRPDLSFADLSFTNLSNADLTDVNLIEADLTEAILTHADLSFANLSDADLTEANLIKANLIKANLIGAKLFRANLTEADLRYTSLTEAILTEAILTEAILSNADLTEANLFRANLIGANLFRANLSDADLSNADLTEASVGGTVFGNVDLSTVKSLDTIYHTGPSTIGIDTIYRSHGNVPEVFLRKAGVQETFLTNMRALVDSMRPIDFYSCFISYSSKDQSFAERLYADLLSKGVRCWFALEDMDIGDKIRPRIEESIRLYDKLLLVLSEHAISSKWVAYEVERALNKEPEGIPNVLYPIRLDNTIMQSKAGWADDIRRTRQIGDFTNWKNHDDYQKAFNRLLRALKTETQKMESQGGATNSG